MNRSASRDIEQLRVSLMWRVVQIELDEARQLILIDFIQTYFELSDEQMARYRRLVYLSPFLIRGFKMKDIVDMVAEPKNNCTNPVEALFQ